MHEAPIEGDADIPIRQRPQEDDVEVVTYLEQFVGQHAVEGKVGQGLADLGVEDDLVGTSRRADCWMASWMRLTLIWRKAS
jgi:hypothetical protein